MEVMIDPDVKAVAEFMQGKIEAHKLVGVAESLQAIAPILWGRYKRTPVNGIELLSEPIRPSHGSRLTATLSERTHSDVDGGSAAVAVGL